MPVHHTPPPFEDAGTLLEEGVHRGLQLQVTVPIYIFTVAFEDYVQREELPT